MAKPHPIELRERVVAHVEEGNTHRATAAHFRVSIKFVNDMVILKRERGSLDPRANSRHTGHGKLAPYRDWISKRIGEKADITVMELCAELEEKFGIHVNRSPMRNMLHKLGFTHKKRYFMPKSNSVLT